MGVGVGFRGSDEVRRTTVWPEFLGFAKALSDPILAAMFFLRVSAVDPL